MKLSLAALCCGVLSTQARPRARRNLSCSRKSGTAAPRHPEWPGLWTAGPPGDISCLRAAPPALQPVELPGEHVQHRLAGQVTVALVRQQHQPRGPAVPLDRLVEPLGLDRERARVV